MDSKTLPSPGSEDDLRAENEVIKLKLEVEYGMKGFGSTMSPELENQWLKSVYEFEEMFKKAKDITVYDLIGRPAFKRWYTVKKDRAFAELQRILRLLEAHGIGLTRLDVCDDAEFYRIITEEVFPMKFGQVLDGPICPPIGAWFMNQIKVSDNGLPRPG